MDEIKELYNFKETFNISFCCELVFMLIYFPHD